MTSDSASRAALVKKHSQKKSLLELPREERLVIGMGSLMRGLQRSDVYVDQLGLSSADLAKVKAFGLTEKDFFTELGQQNAAELKKICSWGDAADAGVLAAAMTAIEEQMQSQIAVRYLTLLDSLSTEGRKQLESQLLDDTKSGSQTKTNLASLAVENPGLVKQGVLRRCASPAARTEPTADETRAITIKATPTASSSEGDRK